MKDNPFGATTKVDHFIETRIDYGISSSIPDDDGTRQAFIGVYLTMDDTYKLTIRRVTTFSAAFASISGFMGIVFLIAFITIRCIQELNYDSISSKASTFSKINLMKITYRSISRIFQSLTLRT